jgi:hypothetical protein
LVLVAVVDQNHVGRGKFKVISEGDKYVDNIIIDASDIFHCRG